jgi:hypothetical protein
MLKSDVLGEDRAGQVLARDVLALGFPELGILGAPVVDPPAAATLDARR